MASEKKIFLDKDDDLNKVVGQLTAVEAEKIILNIPKNSVLGSSVHNFQILERECETAGKELAIESVDERILELASLATIPAINPVFKTRERSVVDILPGLDDVGAAEIELVRQSEVPNAERGGKEKIEGRKPARKSGVKKPRVARKKKAPAIEETKIPITEPVASEEELVKYIPAPIVEERIEKNFERIERNVEKKAKRGKKFWAIMLVSTAVVLAAGYFAVADILPRAIINIFIQKTTVPFSIRVTADKEVNTPSVSGNAASLPGQLSVAPGNLSMNFPATGSSTLSTKAGGTLTVYNVYSTKSQTLVATTRFESPEGKIFRLVNRAVVPGMKTANGTPSSVEVKVVADKAGSDYNLPPSGGWKIPGFKATPALYKGFYAESISSMTGGAEGNQIVPSESDVSGAKAKIEEALLNTLKSKTMILDSQNLKIMDNGSEFKVTSENVSSQVDQDGNFSVLVAGELRQLGFNEGMLRDALVDFLSTSTEEITVRNFSMDYSTSTADFAAGKMTFSVNGVLTYEPKINLESFKNQILGLDGETLKTQIFALPGLQKANISFWPFWVKSVPNYLNKVKILAE
ncbi:MAG: hypothetical protein AAB377_00360 [Patescibacteria group bacterium]